MNNLLTNIAIATLVCFIVITVVAATLDSLTSRKPSKRCIFDGMATAVVVIVFLLLVSALAIDWPEYIKFIEVHGG